MNARRGAGDLCRIEWVGTDGHRALLDVALTGRAVDAALADDRFDGCLLIVRLCDDAESAALHAQHFADPTPTDVMTFPDGGEDFESGLRRLGDLAIGVEVARRIADARGRPIAEELALYVLHGVLHLLGHDDHDPVDAAEMWLVQRRILGTLGVEIGAAP